MSAVLRSQQQGLQAAVCEGSAAEHLLQEPNVGLTVYREAFRARLLAALRDNFTVLQRALGDESFDALGLAYIQARPSRQPSIRWFGESLADFMADEFAAELTHPCMVDFARMDWALRAAFDSADAALLSFAQLAALAPEEWPALVFELHPSVRLLAMNWAIEPAWSALRAHDPDSAEPAPELREPAALDHHLLVWREGLETYWRSLEPLEAQLLQALAAGQDFEAICQQAALTVGTDLAAAAVVQALQGWLARGLLSRLQSRAS
ncbi:HvfC/BufC N-terminal domain-containing protein [Roseateles oligotrophus]|uniref:DNA-binding domain-containing protein n=1 Tax=Roseateles oligotrophus TaxID=1769250 RepID=A0ABT2YD70_9BURK|nr:DNA-binding domain-containing protein [Roseateles oligotrophus]MCV2367976.1 putative DNA-binding domain-containing protein [Roseateles oligotrophus]